MSNPKSPGSALKPAPKVSVESFTTSSNGPPSTTSSIAALEEELPDEQDDDISNRTLLSDYYGIALASAAGTDVFNDNDNDSDTAASTAHDEDDERRQEREVGVGMAYRVGAGAAKDRHQRPVHDSSRTDLDTKYFDPEMYVSSMLSQHNVKDLMAIDKKMSVKRDSLDGEMQMLVYDNYNKFITATDMIRKMKDNVQSMEDEMNHLLQSISSISQSASSIETALEPSQTSVNKYVGLTRLLSRLEFLFELPARLTKSIHIGAYQQAVKYWRISNRILQQHNHIPSFEKIRVESEAIIRSLKNTLRMMVKDSSASAQTQMENAAMLMDLGEDADALLADLFTARKNKLRQDIQMAHTVAQSYLIDELADDLPLRKADPVRRDETRDDGCTLTTIEEPDEKGCVLVTTVLYDRDGTELQREAEMQDPPAPRSLISALCTDFVDHFALFTDTYLDTFVRPHDSLSRHLQRQQRNNGNNNNGGGNGNGSGGGKMSSKALQAKYDVVQKCKRALTDFTQSVFEEYFTLARKELLRRATLPTTMPKESRRVLTLTRIIKQFWQGLQRPSSLVPAAHLRDKCAEVIEHVIRHCVESVFDKAQHDVITLLRDLHDQVAQHAPVLQAAVSAKSPDARSQTHPTEMLPADHKDASIPSGRELSRALRLAVEHSLAMLVPLLSTQDYLPSELGLGFSNLAHSHLESLLGWFSQIIMCGVLRESEGPVHDLRAANPLADLASVSQLKYPMYFLYLSQLCRHMDKLDVPAVFNYLKRHFPAHDPSSSSSSASSSSSINMNMQLEGEIAVMRALMRESASTLLQRYVEANGFHLTTAIMRTRKVSTLRDQGRFDGANQEVQRPTNVSYFVRALWKELNRVEAELNEVWPAPKASTLPLGASSIITDPSSSARDLLSSSTSLTPSSSSTTLSASSSSSSASSSSSSSSSVRQSRLQAAKQHQARDLDRDMQKLFKRKQRVYGHVKYNRSATLVALLKIAFKCLVELTRLESLAPRDLFQVQLNMFAIRSEFVTALNKEDYDDLVPILEEVVTSAKDRTVQTMVLMDEATLSAIYKGSSHYNEFYVLMRAQQMQQQQQQQQSQSLPQSPQ